MKILLVTFLLLTSTLVIANDPVQEFSIIKNPNGVWSYGFTPTLGGPFTLADAKMINYMFLNEWQQGSDSWVSRSQATCDNGIGGTIARIPEQQHGTESFPPATLHQHPGCLGQYSVLRWTAPLNGSYQFHGTYRGAQTACGGTSTDTHVRLNSTTSLFDVDVYGFQDNFFNVTQQVWTGDTVDFAVGFGRDGDYRCDGTVLYLRVDLLPKINIKPADATNTISLSKPGDISVAILSDASFDATTLVDRSSLTFGRIGDEQTLVLKADPTDLRLRVPVCNTADVNSDGLRDLVCVFERKQTGFQLSDAYGVLRGRTVTGITIKGTDSVHIVK